jgi:hypothetical protein
MSNENETLVEGLVEGTIAEVTKVKRVKKVLTAEEIVAVAASVEVIKTIEGISENFGKLLAVVPQWTDAEANKSIKDAVAEDFGGVLALKAYVVDENGLAKDIAVLAGIKEVLSTLGSVKSLYSRVSAPRVKKGGKKIQVSIAGILYLVNAEFMVSIADLTKDEKVAQIMAHPSLTIMETVELL